MQVSKIENCRLKNWGRYENGYAQGGCNVFKHGGTERAWLCFSYFAGHRCDS